MSVRPHPKQKTHPKYASTWIIDYYPDGREGKRERVPWEGSEVDAYAAEASWRAKTRKPETLAFPRIREAYPHFVEHYKLGHQPKGTQRTIRSIKILLQFFGNLQFSSITEEVVDQYKSLRLEQVKPTTINKELSALSMMCKWAKKKRYCEEIKIERFPPRLTKAPLPDIHKREDVLALINSMPWPKQGLYWCLYYGGLRSEEARNLVVEKINLQLGVMLVVGKGNKERVVPVIGDLAPILEKRINEIETGLLWPGPKGNKMGDLRKTIEWAQKRTKIKGHYTPHSFRHAFGTHATMAGVNLRTLQEVMGHSTSTTTELYTRLAAGALSEEMKKFSMTPVVKK